MKILHFADIHIGYENYGQMDEKVGLNTRLLDFLNTFDYLVTYILNHDIDLVVFAGDAYKTRDPNPTYQREFSKRIKKIASKTPIVLVIGNHDIPPSYGKADTLEIFPTLEVPNVYVFSTPSFKEINISNTKVQILALPWLPRFKLITEEDRKKSVEKLKEIVSNKITQKFYELLTQIDPGKPAIAVVHQSVSGATYSSNQETYLGNDPLIPVTALSDPRLSYVALGHLHKFQVLNENPPVIYSGSLERIDFGEEAEEKGFIVATIEAGQKTKWNFVPVPARKFKTINVQLPEEIPDPTEFIKEQIKKAQVKDSITKINVNGKDTDLAKIIDSELKNILKEAFWASIIKKSEERVTKIEIIGDVLDPIQWLSKYLEAKNFNKNEQKRLKEAALKLIEESGGSW